MYTPYPSAASTSSLIMIVLGETAGLQNRSGTGRVVPGSLQGPGTLQRRDARLWTPALRADRPLVQSRNGEIARLHSGSGVEERGARGVRRSESAACNH